MEDLESVNPNWMSNFPKLNLINLSSNQLKAPVKLSGNKKLEHITLDANMIGPTLDMQVFADVQMSLIDLRLSSNAIETFVNNHIYTPGSDSYKQISNLTFPRLTHLEMDFNRLKMVTDRDLINFPALTHLNLEFNQIASIGNNAFKYLTKLEHLRISNNEIL